MSEIFRKIDKIKKLRSKIFENRKKIPLFKNSLKDVKKVVIINSSSRSGSSLLYALLSKLPQCYSLTGEASPFYKLNTYLDRFNPHQSDRIPKELIDDVIDLEGVSSDFISDIYLNETVSEPADIDFDSYVDDLMLRLLLQWTDIDFDLEVLRSSIAGSLESYLAENRLFNTENFYLSMLERLNSFWHQINPFYYDIGTDKVALKFPFLEIPKDPPTSGFTIEEPPYVLLPPRNRPDVQDLTDKTLLLKSTVDCYRMNLVARLLPNAEIRIIHLVRNPAATINGIFDGWHHRGFFSHNLAHCFNDGGIDKLKIKGYSDIYPHGSKWWNFDLPDGWQSVANLDLVDVCAFQWYSANTEILSYLAKSGCKSCLIHFEDLIRSLESRTLEFERLLNFIGISTGLTSVLGLDALPIVQSTLPPQLYRWKSRQDMIARVLDAPRISEMAEFFGYRTENMEGWL
ncbi:MAG: hypothetical protein PHN84_12615 [Desulfuromonadaceae bacterium]|nr:hypothetical protein [Desulfuromonadaceae bacterium]MDD2854340.1 hypothetical protein [Desulfuromonadaceae bacterium]